MDEPSTGLGTRLPPGWDDHWSGVWSSEQRSPLRPALVTRIDKGGITVSESRGEERLVIAAKGARRVVVGDMVALDADAGRIEEILPRRTVFERRSPGVARDQVQISSRPLASNMDTVLVLQPLERGVNLARLARELVLSWESGATPVVVLTKTDLVTAEDRESQRAAAQSFAPDTEVLCVSTRSEAGLAELESKIDTESVIALMGTSGAGKSSLVNTLAGRPVQLTADVRETDRKGRHTTTAGQIVELRDGSLLIDTPGIRGGGLWAADEGFEKAFSDLSPFAQSCRFDDCTHTNEPGCGVLRAVESGGLARERLDVFHALAAELDELEEGIEVLDRHRRRERNQRSRRRVQSRDSGGHSDDDGSSDSNED